jgi:hypothetical protein
MKTKPTNKQQQSQPQPPAQTPTLERVQQRAYELFLARGQEPGHELDDWIQAERELMHTGNGPAIRQAAQ